MPYLTISEYAKLNGISRQAVEDRIARGTLPCTVRDVKVKRRVIFVNEKELEALAQRQGEE